ncbi:hydroxymethylglutaryl-CoA lyase [Pseudomonas sp. RIT-PI-S]|uniref:hydroxymethylglutaryl-CoA lyase n=1 Tax=Pseudomonas sp. RIT-PI-S TaxID=3035295 RepID=UPI0021DA97B4|nr:hydroxymethylglutaryl-CoA lyase [Pseudomonas sp. RIT-PI-S]
MLPERVRVVEVGPRDGLQNEPLTVPAEEKVRLVNGLAGAGLGYIEVGSFVAPKWVPQMADTASVFAAIEHLPGVVYAALTPNLRGLESAMASGVREVAVFAAASEGFSQRNINCSIAQSLERFEPVLALALKQGMRVRGYVSCVLGCPYDGDIRPEQVRDVAQALLDMGCYEVSLGDTIGVGTAGSTRKLIDVVSQRVPRHQLAGHFHNTYGQALANVYASLLEGVAVFDSAIGGLGGCPYAKGASGNLATEDLLYLLHGLGIHTGVDLEAVVRLSQQFNATLGRLPDSRVTRAAMGSSHAYPAPP